MSGAVLSHHEARTRADLGTLVRDVAAAGQAVYPRGGDTLSSYGLPIVRPGIVLDLRRLNRVIDYPARDMTITVEAGITISELQAVLAREGQTLPVDIPHPDLSTLGGALAANLSGPRRLGYGTLRDYLIGVHFVYDEGKQCKAGGRVVKNVAGYDLCKLLIGAWGTLGIITEATLKVRPIPEARAAVLAGVPEGRLEAVLAAVHETQSRPVAVSVRWNSAAPEATELILGFEEKTTTVNWQLERSHDEFRALELKASSIQHGDAASALFQNLTDALLPGAGADWVWKASVPASQVAAFMTQARRTAGSLVAHAENGIVIGQARAGVGAEPVAALRALARSWNGSLVVWRAPESHRRSDVLWGPDQADFAMMRKLKAELDPKSVLNAVRYAFD